MESFFACARARNLVQSRGMFRGEGFLAQVMDRGLDQLQFRDKREKQLQKSDVLVKAWF